MNKKIKIVFTLGLAALFSVYACSTITDGDEQRMKRIENSLQYQDGVFKNDKEWQDPSMKELGSSTWEFLFKNNQRTPRQILPRQEADLTYFIDSGKDQLSLNNPFSPSLVGKCDS